MAGPRISVIIPAYKAAATLPLALDSVFAQTYLPAEVLVIDDGSPEDQTAALAPYADRVRHIVKDNGGAASARNHGLDHATGDLIAFLDSDDHWEPNKLARQVELLVQHPDLVMTAGRAYAEVPGQPREFLKLALPPIYEKPRRPTGSDIINTAVMVWTSMLLVRREALGDLRFDTTLRTAEDVDLWIRLLMRGGVYLTWEPLATAVLRPGSLSRSDPSRDFPNMLTVIRRYKHLLSPAELCRWEARIFRDWAASSLTVGDPRGAMHPAWERLKREPWKLQCWWILFKSAVWSMSPFRMPINDQR